VTRGLRQLDPLVGEWTSESNADPEGRGRMSVAPAEDAKFLRIESRSEDERFPVSIQLVGADDSRDECTSLYYDSRGVYRVYLTSLVDREWKLWRHAPGFNQRFVGALSKDGRTIAAQWEFSENGQSWKIDFDITYTKVAAGEP